MLEVRKRHAFLKWKTHADMAGRIDLDKNQKRQTFLEVNQKQLTYFVNFIDKKIEKSTFQDLKSAFKVIEQCREDQVRQDKIACAMAWGFAREQRKNEMMVKATFNIFQRGCPSYFERLKRENQDLLKGAWRLANALDLSGRKHKMTFLSSLKMNIIEDRILKKLQQ